jgi:thymidylate synthase (FAD)
LKVELIRYTVKPEEAMAIAASTCYRSVPKDKVVEHCILSGHEAISEFGDFHFLVSDVSRALTHQLVRHRLASFAQESQRYVSMDEFNYVVPPSVQKDNESYVKFKMMMDEILSCYTDLQNRGIPNEDARFVLPNACTSKINVKMNFREIMHACAERECSRAQWEIRALFKEIHRQVAEVSPFLGKYLGPKCFRLGYCPELRESCGLRPRKTDLFGAYEWWVQQDKPSLN